MQFNKIHYSERSAVLNQQLDLMVNTLVRRFDRAKEKIGLQGRKGAYDDEHYEFVGGPGDMLRKKHYDKSLRLLWKAEQHAPWSSFADCSKEEKLLFQMANQAMTPKEKTARKRISNPEFRALLNREYTRKEKEAIVAILSVIGHGEAYAWLVSAELLNEVKSTGARAALTMQVLEEAKHFVVLRELIQAFGIKIPRETGWEYILLERVFKAKGMEKLFGMNVIIEGVALGVFGMMSTFPGLEILRLFHLDEARHTGLPANYFNEFPMSEWTSHNPINRIRRLSLVLPFIPLLFLMEKNFAELGMDVFEFGGSVGRKLVHLCNRVGFYLPMPGEILLQLFNQLFNGYCSVTRSDHQHQNFIQGETTSGIEELRVEQQAFGYQPQAIA